MFKEALKVKNMKLVFGTDAVAGGHGKNVDELIARVQQGQPAMDAVVSATSRAAESLDLQKEVGSIAAGLASTASVQPSNADGEEASIYIQ